MKLSGILSQSLGGIYTLRGYSNYGDIIGLSYPHSGYQRPVEQKHLEELTEFIAGGKNNFSPEVVLSYTLKYDYSKTGQKPTVDPISDIVSGVTFKSNVDGISIKKGRALECGAVCTMTIPDKQYATLEKRPFRRVDGNHRLQAIEKIIQEGKSLGTYIIPFCIILFMDNDSLKNEKVIFHNINSKAVPIKSEQLLKGILDADEGALTFSDSELNIDFGFEYSFTRRFVETHSALVKKFKSIEWIGEENTLSVLMDLISYVETENKTAITESSQEEAFYEAVSQAIRQGIKSEEKIMLSSGLLYLLTLLYFQEEFDNTDETKSTIASLLAWVKKYDIAALQVHDTRNCATNANCIRNVFNQYITSSMHTIFMSRCFGSEYDENERAIRRAITAVNTEKHVNIKLERVDRHTEGVSGDIYARIDRGISNCGLLIADLSGGKPNVHHEIGLAMGKEKDFIIIHNGTDSEADQHTPSNIKMYEQIRFSNNNYARLESEIKNRLIDFYRL